MSSLIAYNRWANETLLEVASRLAGEVRSAAAERSGVSIDSTLAHILLAQHVWHRRFTGADTAHGGSEPKVASPQELSTGFSASHHDLDAFAQAFTDTDWERRLDYHSSDGTPHRRQLGELVAHLVNHGSYHRGEVAYLLTEAGHSPGDLDYLYRLSDSFD
ncbi:MAG: DinB family protein [Actinomycetota bacterium]